MIQAVPDNVAYYQTAHLFHEDLHKNNQGEITRQRWFSALHGCRKLLEVGCGNGRLCEWLVEANTLAECGKQVMGVDLVGGPYDRKDKGYEFQTCDIQEQPLPRGFDAVLSFDVLEHMDPAKIGYVLANIDASAPVCVLQIAGYEAKPEHLIVKSPGWWLNAISNHMKITTRQWAVQVFTRYRQMSSPVYLFIGTPQ